jgi:hypothetical protein
LRSTFLCHQIPRLKRKSTSAALKGEQLLEKEEDREYNEREVVKRRRRRRKSRRRKYLFSLSSLFLLLLPLLQLLWSACCGAKRLRSSHSSSSVMPAVDRCCCLRPHAFLFLLLLCAWSASLLPYALAAKASEFQCDQGKKDLLACLPKDYSKFELPSKNAVTNIGITLDIQEVLRINDKDYSITFSCYFNVHWTENRIRLSPEFGRDQAGPGENITGNPDIMVPTNLEFVKDLWVPNILIYNLKTYKVIDVLNKLAGLWIMADKSVLYSQATHITFICPMRFDKFPLDKQLCKFTLGSYSYNDASMVFLTTSAGYTAPKISNSIALDYSIKITKLNHIDTILDSGNLGNYSLAGFEMVLHRYVSTYIITYYLPSGLFVIVSWISFLIPMDVIPGRMALLVTLFLVLVNIFNSVTTNTPKAEGLTAIEAWMLACILFVFGALIE